ncbi:hypothetical protein JCM17844_08580 [Iodidimonas gelatinilytica]|uniref:Uncharacterized protein n=1 Tax=Iodidimonas gelatinilytica TaxID=1236966 RepID=A0A5A7MU34_9PROT|nr:DUF6111 family protein [Iodidimonas gelatinilytica]GEQ97221.1 hypothetical protein JCM17844_08580 [Iodidimonas gelatinilytica]GEQ99552.1 hypothetical protein JCM17845_01760 [Iodidimonas gelatinilytica]
MSAVFLRLGLFLLPFAFFLLWLWLVRRLKQAGDETNPRLEKAVMLGGGVFVLAYAVVLYFYAGTTERADENMRYVPATTVDGEIVPGHFEKIPDN